MSEIRKRGRFLIIMALTFFVGLLGTASAQAATKTVTGTYEEATYTISVPLTDPESVIVEPEDYINILGEADLGNGLSLLVESKKDYLQVEKTQTAEAKLKNEKKIKEYKAKQLNKQHLQEAQEKADAKAEAKYNNVWELPSETMQLPEGTDGSTKTYMDYTTVTSQGSNQYHLLNSEKAYSKDGFRMYDGYYCIALGSYYGNQIGTKYYITLSNGNTLRCILGDQKSDRHTNDTHQYAVKNHDVVEFIVDKLALSGGDVSEIEGFDGSIVSIKRITDDHTNTYPYGYDWY